MSVPQILKSCADLDFDRHHRLDLPARNSVSSLPKKQAQFRGKPEEGTDQNALLHHRDCNSLRDAVQDKCSPVLFEEYRFPCL